MPEVFAVVGALDAPAQAPEESCRELCWLLIDADAAGGVERDLWSFHFAESGGFEAFAVEDGFDEECVVVRGGV